MPDQTPPTPDEQPHDPWLVDRLVAGSAAGDSPLAELLAAATAPGTEAELAEEGAVLAAFVSAGPRGTVAATGRSGRLSSRMVAAVAVGALSLAGVGAAALGGALPGQGRDGGHQSRGPETGDASGSASSQPTGSDSSPGDGVSGSPWLTTGPGSGPATGPVAPGAGDDTGPGGPDATGSALSGLCTAYLKGGLSENSVAYRSLVTAAGGEENLDQFCADAPHPGNAPSAHPGGPGSHPASPTKPPKTKPQKPTPSKSKSPKPKPQSHNGGQQPRTPSTSARAATPGQPDRPATARSAGGPAKPVPATPTPG